MCPEQTEAMEGNHICDMRPGIHWVHWEKAVGEAVSSTLVKFPVRLLRFRKRMSAVGVRSFV